MNDIALLAAEEWAKAHAPSFRNPVEFGARVALVHLAATLATRHGVTASSDFSAALSIPPEVQQALALLSSHSLDRLKEPRQINSPGAGASV